MGRITRTPDGVSVRLEAEETTLLRTLMEQLLALLGELPGADGELASLGITENASRPDDPVLARLFPDAYRDDGEAAGEFRRYTEMGLRDGKREAAGTVLDGLSAHGSSAQGPGARGPGAQGADIVLDDEQAQAWLRALNDVRLALGTRLDITEDWYDEVETMDPDDPRTPLYAAYDWLTMLQESLVQALW